MKCAEVATVVVRVSRVPNKAPFLEAKLDLQEPTLQEISMLVYQLEKIKAELVSMTWEVDYSIKEGKNPPNI